MSAAVALRSADPVVVDAVRSVAVLADVPLTVHPPGAPAPEASVLLDSAAESRRGDPAWHGQSSRFSWVGVTPGAVGPDGGACLVLPEAAEDLLARVRIAVVSTRAHVVGVVGARGGAGASSLAAVLARCCADDGLSVALVDLDLDGGGLDVLLGIEHEPGWRWADLGGQPGGFGPQELSGSLPTWHGVHVLSSDLRGAARSAREGVLASLVGEHAVVVLDLSREAARPEEIGRWCRTVLVVAACDVQSIAGAQVAARTLAGLDARLAVRGPAPGGLLPSDVATASGLPLAMSMAQERSLSAALERGVAPGDHRRGPLRRGGVRLLTELGLT